MFGFKPEVPEMDAPKVLDSIEKEIYVFLKPYGFRKHGRTLHRFVAGDISQVVNFQLGQAYLGVSHILCVNIGIRIPECMLRSFQLEETPKKYYQEYDCNMRSRLGEVEGNPCSTYDLQSPAEIITADILRQLKDIVLPAFDALCSREAILEHRREYPNFDLLNGHLILLEEAMIYGCWGDLASASKLFRQYYDNAVELSKKSQIPNHIKYLHELAGQLGIELDVPRQKA